MSASAALGAAARPPRHAPITRASSSRSAVSGASFPFTGARFAGEVIDLGAGPVRLVGEAQEVADLLEGGRPAAGSRRSYLSAGD